MNLLFRLAALAKIAGFLKAAMKKAPVVIQTVRTSLDSWETAAVQELLAKAESGDASAQYDCGENFYSGQCVPKDYTEAARWFAKAAEQGHTQAQANLGVLLVLGRGVSKDAVEGLKWLMLAAAKQNPLALKTQAKIMQRVSQDQIDEAQRRAAQFAPRRQAAPEQSS